MVSTSVSLCSPGSCGANQDGDGNQWHGCIWFSKGKGYGFAKDLTTKPNIYRAGLKYKNADWLFTLNANAVTGQSEKNFVDSSYFTLDLGAQYKINDNAKLFINGYNLTNARYAEFGGLYKNGEARYPMAGRSFIIGAEYTF